MKHITPDVVIITALLAPFYFFACRGIWINFKKHFK